MNTTKRKTTSLLAAAALAIGALPATAAAEDYFVPEGNSAVNQYSESYPTAGGNRDAKHNSDLSVPKAIGAQNADKLDKHGAAGREAAEVAAETGPAPAAIEPSGKSAGPSHLKPADEDGKGDEQEQGAGAPGQDTGGGNGGAPASDGSATAVPASSTTSGSGGLGEVIAKAIGIGSPGDLGFLLPLFLVAALAWAASYALRHTHKTTE